MSSNNHKQRNSSRDVSLPPISHILTTDSNGEGPSLSLPPLRSNEVYYTQHGMAPSRTPVGQRPVAHDLGSLNPRTPTSGGRHDHSFYGRNDGISPPSTNSTAYHHQHPRQSHTRYYPPTHHETSQSSSQIAPGYTAGRSSGNNLAQYAPAPSGYSGGGAPGYPAHYEGRAYPTSGPGTSYHDPGATPYSHHQDMGAEDQGSSRFKYECSYCGKGFLRPSALRIHLISHTGDKDYVCPDETCGRRFGVRSNMLRHIRLVHQNLHQSSGEELSNDEWIS
ncbi:hypothetical protein PM082_001222 [Marasmius tenuissimus]|nr:hypothetical protein PM082_001222 [Marasmius tenuissimus]